MLRSTARTSRASSHSNGWRSHRVTVVVTNSMSRVRHALPWIKSVQTVSGWDTSSKSAAQNLMKWFKFSLQTLNKITFLGVVQCDDNTNAWFTTMTVIDHPVKFKTDSGADVTTMSKHVYDRMHNAPQLIPNPGRLLSPGGDIPCHGMFMCGAMHKNSRNSFKIVVVEGYSCLLGHRVAAKMGIIQKVEAVKDMSPGVQWKPRKWT